MTGFWTMLKMNARLLFRNVGYLCFLVLLPMVAVLVLNITADTSASYGWVEGGITYVDKEDEKIQNMGSLRMNTKVHDYAVTELSGYLLAYLQNTGCYELFCYQEAGGGLPDAEAAAIETINGNTVDAILVIPDDFDELVSGGRYRESISLFYGHEDARVETLQENINQFFRNYETFAAAAEGDRDLVLQLLAQTKEVVPVLSTHHLKSGSAGMTVRQEAQKASVKYSWAAITMAFLFSGVYVSNLIIMERNNGVLRRMRLSSAEMTCYWLVKLCMTLFTVVIQTGVMGIGIWLFVKADFGITMAQYLLVTFGLALILNLLSVVIGILVNDLLSTNYAAFFASTMMSLLAGLYFPLETEGWISSASLLTPQRWGIKAVELLLVGDKSAYGYYALAVAGFLAMLGCVGLLGLNGLRKEEG